jgi:hypothetical protein
MARMAQSDQHASLFPYLSVLLCIIGVLFLGVVVVSTGQLSLKAELAKHQDMWKEYQSLLRQHEMAAEAASKLQALRDAGQADQTDLTDLREGVRSLESVAADAILREDQLKQVQQEIAALQAKLLEKRQQNADLTKAQEDRRLAARAIPKPGTVKIVGAAKMNTGQDGKITEAAQKPLFLECRGDNLIILPGGTVVPSATLDRSSVFQERIARAESERDQGTILIFLIRTDGVKTFDRAHAILQKRAARYGFLPIPGSGDVDLSDFN